MNLHCMSTLTTDEEHLMAAGVIRFLSALLDSLPAGYVIEVCTSDERSYRCIRPIAAQATSTVDRIAFELFDEPAILN